MSIDFVDKSVILNWAEGIWGAFDDYQECAWALESELDDMTQEEIEDCKLRCDVALSEMRKLYKG